MPEMLTRDTFIDPNYVQNAVGGCSTMVVETQDENRVKRVPVPDTVKSTGAIPDGYSVDFAVDPMTLLDALKKRGITSVDQLEDSELQALKKIMNNVDNLDIVPTDIHKQKLEHLKTFLGDNTST